MTTDANTCECGAPLHYSDPRIEKFMRELVVRQGRMVPVTTPRGTWLVSRHYIALHGLRAAELPTLGFPKIK